MGRWRFLKRRGAEPEPAADELAEAELVARAHAGDADALDTLAARVRDPLLRACLYRLGDWDAAEEAAQEALLRAFVKLATYDPRGAGSFRAWVIRIAHNEAIDQGRRRTRRPDATPMPEQPTWPTCEPSPESQAIARDELVRLAARVQRLPEKQRRVIELLFSGLSHREIAARTGETEANVRQLKGRALDALQGWQEGTDG